ncbi:hypothetical protein ALC57_18451, partial [Trachymyrmex cornetzi]
RVERKKNIIIRGIEEGKGGIEGRIREILEKLEVGVEIENIRKVEAGRKEKGWMGVVTLRSEEERGRVLNSKGKLKGSEIWIEEDRT